MYTASLPTLSTGQQLSIIYSWNSKQLTAALDDYFDVDDGTINFNIGDLNKSPNRQSFDFNNINDPHVLRKLLHIYPDCIECFNTYNPLLIQYALDLHIDLNDLGYEVPLDKLIESLEIKFKKSALTLSYFIDILEFIASYYDVSDKQIQYLISISHLNYMKEKFRSDCVGFKRFLNITSDPKIFKSLLRYFEPKSRLPKYISNLQIGESFEANEYIKEVIGVDCIECIINSYLHDGGSISFVSKQIVVERYNRVITKFKLLNPTWNP